MQEPSEAEGPRQFDWATWTILAVIVLAGVLRIRLLEVPLERDEGGYAYLGQLIRAGTPPFAAAYDMKMPGIHYIYAGIMTLFGETAMGIRLGLMAFTSASIFLLYRITRQLFDPASAVMAGAAFATMSLSQSVQGFTANCEPILLAFALGGIALTLRASDTGRLRDLLLAGVVLGLAWTIKHQGMLFALFSVTFFVLDRGAWHNAASRRPLWLRIAVLVAGVVLPVALLAAYFASLGHWNALWFWTVDYTLVHGQSLGSPGRGIHLLVNQLGSMADSMLPLWILALLGAGALALDRNRARQRRFVGLLVVYSATAVSLGWRFFPHYFQLAIPVIAILAGVGTTALGRRLTEVGTSPILRIAAIVVALYAILNLPVVESDYLFRASPNEISRSTYGAEFPFPESVEIARYIARNSGADDRIAVLGSEPQICFYAGRRCASSHIYVYPLMGRHPRALEMQQEMIEQIEAARPEYLVVVNHPTSWWPTPESPRRILDWQQRYRERHYEQVGVTDVRATGATVYRWGPAARRLTPRSERSVQVFRRTR